MNYNKKTVRDIDVAGKKVLLRCDFNVPMAKDGSGTITDDKRIQAALPTIQYLLDNQAAVIACSHMGKPKGKWKSELSLAPVAKRLSADRSDPQRVLEVRFKSVEAGWRMVTGQISAEGAWARHDLLINGEITQAMRFLRCIQRAQAYLIPAGMANQVLPLQEPLPVKRWRVWLRMLHVKKRKPGEQED